MTTSVSTVNLCVDQLEESFSNNLLTWLSCYLKTPVQF